MTLTQFLNHVELHYHELAQKPDLYRCTIQFVTEDTIIIRQYLPTAAASSGTRAQVIRHLFRQGYRASRIIDPIGFHLFVFGFNSHGQRIYFKRAMYAIPNNYFVPLNDSL
jgi:hypothetical protein